ncbi:MAG: tRNA 5-hydroxyuridine modification protein YegQ [Gammaproteobacteria bacterium]
MKIPELLAPAGTLPNLRYAIAYGADAVYAGIPRYSLRVRNNDFHQLDILSQGIEEAHANQKKFFLAANLLPHNRKVDTFLADLAEVVELNPDALIMADPGLIMLVREKWPDLIIHLSVQANTMNYASVKFWQSQGIRRIILSRELSLDEVQEIRQQCPDIELEVFVHGALCIAYSGRCLLSGYFNHRDANQGSCTNSCRWKYKVHGNSEDDSGDVRQCSDSEVSLLEEVERPGEFMPIEEDEHGTYIMNSKDLRAVQHVSRLINIGVDSLKIEGRTKNYYYVARVTQSYRHAIDDAVAEKPFNASLLNQLDKVANRGYTEGFYVRNNTRDYQNYVDGSSTSNSQRFVGELVDFDPESGLAEVNVKNKFAIGDQLELVLPSGNKTFKLQAMQTMKGEPLDVVPGSGYRVKIPYDQPEFKYGLLARYLDG